MKVKVLISLLIFTSLFGYLEWGSDQHTFLCETERQVLGKLFSDPKFVAYPFIFIPLLGQIVLLIALFQKAVDKKLNGQYLLFVRQKKRGHRDQCPLECARCQRS